MTSRCITSQICDHCMHASSNEALTRSVTARIPSRWRRDSCSMHMCLPKSVTSINRLGWRHIWRLRYLGLPSEPSRKLSVSNDSSRSWLYSATIPVRLGWARLGRPIASCSLAGLKALFGPWSFWARPPSPLLTNYFSAHYSFLSKIASNTEWTRLCKWILFMFSRLWCCWKAIYRKEWIQR